MDTQNNILGCKRVKRGQLWKWYDPIYGNKSEGKQITQKEANTRYSRYVIVIQDENTISENSVLVFPATSNPDKDNIKVAIDYSSYISYAYVKINKCMSVHLNSLTEYICTLSEPHMKMLEAALIKLTMPELMCDEGYRAMKEFGIPLKTVNSTYGFRHGGRSTLLKMVFNFIREKTVSVEVGSVPTGMLVGVFYSWCKINGYTPDENSRLVLNVFKEIFGDDIVDGKINGLQLRDFYNRKQEEKKQKEEPNVEPKPKSKPEAEAPKSLTLVEDGSPVYVNRPSKLIGSCPGAGNHTGNRSGMKDTTYQRVLQDTDEQIDFCKIYRYDREAALKKYNVKGNGAYYWYKYKTLLPVEEQVLAVTKKRGGWHRKKSDNTGIIEEYKAFLTDVCTLTTEECMKKYNYQVKTSVYTKKYRILEKYPELKSFMEELQKNNTTEVPEKKEEPKVDLPNVMINADDLKISIHRFSFKIINDMKRGNVFNLILPSDYNGNMIPQNTFYNKLESCIRSSFVSFFDGNDSNGIFTFRLSKVEKNESMYETARLLIMTKDHGFNSASNLIKELREKYHNDSLGIPRRWRSKLTDSLINTMKLKASAAEKIADRCNLLIER